MIKWVATDLFLFNLEKVLQHTSKSAAEFTVSKDNKILSYS